MCEEACRKQSYSIKDLKMRNYLYLDLSIDELIDKMSNLELVEIGNDKEVPFTASVRSYSGAKDQEGCSWLIKEIPREEALDHKLHEIAYYLDFLMNTLAAPNILMEMGGKYYRVTKNIKNAMQISSYNYLEEPFKSILANDLVNRWLFFDEDRNPNNYLVFHDTDDTLNIIVIDYNKADLYTREMKITGNEDRFGWHRMEKTRFLTLLKPDNFDNLSIETFEERLQDLMGISEDLLKHIVMKSMSCCPIESTSAEEISDLVAANITKRREYINNYFRRWFHKKNMAEEKAEDDRYAGFGQSFLDYYKKKK